MINLEIEEIIDDDITYTYQKLIKMFNGADKIPIRKRKNIPIKNSILYKKQPQPQPQPNPQPKPQPKPQPQ